MCGIGGIMLKDQGNGAAPAIHPVRSMLAAMSHRGPDGQAEYAAGPMTLAANRLAIRGVDQAQPPLFVHASGVVVACNGEIDNHWQLRAWLAARGHAIEASSDIAVIAPLYLEKDLGFVEALDGVFALAIWDPRKQRLILARDRSGERHLYYAASEHAISFASELAALQLVAPADTELDRPSLAHYLHSGYCSSPWTLQSHHFKVCPAEIIVWEGNKTRYMRYWTPPLGKRPTAPPSAAAFDQVFRAAMMRQTDVDVDYGVLLSGGLDSSLITAVARRIHPSGRLNAYCIRFDETSFDEGRHAETVAHLYQCPLSTITMGAADVAPALAHLVRTTGEPLADPAWLPLFMLTRHASRDVKMLLSGEGADELFGGYPTYLGARLSSYYARLPRILRASIRGLVNALPVSDRKVALSFLLKKFVNAQGVDGLDRHMLWNAHLSPEWLHRLGVDYPAKPAGASHAELLDAVQNYDFEHSLPDALMAKADRGGMCHGLEIRAPFLDRGVIEFAATLPAHARVSGLQTKVFLKDYAQRYLPAQLIRRRKRGLSVPLGSWLRGPLKDWAYTKLAGDDLRELDICTASALQLMDEHVSKQRDHSRGLWTLIVLSEWQSWLRSTRLADGRSALGEQAAVDQPVIRPAQAVMHQLS
jgi:asparagine synthase (glutamine-hydrolysing)